MQKLKNNEQTEIIVEDTLSDGKMYLKQIISLTDLMLINADINDIPNLMTIKELAEKGLEKLELISGID